MASFARGAGAEAGAGHAPHGSAGGRRPVLEGKVIVIGSVSVGKTSLLGRLTKPYTDLREVRPSVGVSFLQHTIQGSASTLRASLWDTAGQERFRAMSSLYYRESAAAVLVFDVSDRQSFDDLPFFLSSVNAAAGTPHVLFLVVANKIDVPPSERVVSTEEARGFADSFGALYHETSAQTGAGVTDAFALIADGAVAAAALQAEHRDDDEADAAAAAGRSPMAGLFREVKSAKRGAGSRSSHLVMSGPEGDKEGAAKGGCC